MKKLILATVSVLALSLPAYGAESIRIVGSSTVFPFATAVAESFSMATGNPTPIVESTGSGGGLKLFCSGLGPDTPDIANASRQIKLKEVKTCSGNGVDFSEFMVGYDGIVVANSRNEAEFSLTVEELTIALASDGPRPTMWNEVNPSLPMQEIVVLGPPPSSGTRDAFEELVMQEGCETTDLVACEGVSIRDDGVWVDAGENDNLIVSKLESNPNALGVFGYSFLDQNLGKMQGASINGYEATFDNIASGNYPISRSLYFYVKNAHLEMNPTIADYVMEFVSDDAAGEEGYLTDRGLIPQDESSLEQQQQFAKSLEKN